MSSFLLIGFAPEAADDSAPNAPVDKAAEAFSTLLTGVQKQFADQGDHLDLCKLPLDGSTEVPVTTQLAHATYDCILLGGGFREPEHLALFERVLNTVHRHAPGTAIGLVNLPQDAPEAALRVLSQDYERAGLLAPSASRKELSMTPSLVTLNPDAGYVTILNTYTVAPERAEALLQTLVRSTNKVLQYVPGFVSASFHMNLDCTQVVNYSQWLSQEAITAAGTDPKVQASMKEVGQIADKFTPILYELRDSVMAAPTDAPTDASDTTTDRAAHVLLLMKKGDDAFNSQDLAAMEAGRHPDMIAHVTGSDKPTQGRAAHAAVQQSIFHAFPDVHLHTDSYLIQFGSGDWMTMVCKITGTFTGELVLPDGKVIPGTGKSFDLHFSRTAKWEGEQMVEEYASWDSALMAQQIGTA